jgi:hypothetical protein
MHPSGVYELYCEFTEPAGSLEQGRDVKFVMIRTSPLEASVTGSPHLDPRAARVCSMSPLCVALG